MNVCICKLTSYTQLSIVYFQVQVQHLYLLDTTMQCEETLLLSIDFP